MRVASGSKVSAACCLLRRVLLRLAEPAQRRPVLKPLLNQCRSLALDHFAFRECYLNRLPKGLAITQSGQDGELFGGDPPEVYGKIHTMHDQKNRRALKLRDPL